MAQHHLLASKSKNIALKDIFRLTESEAFHLLKTKRWCCKHYQRHFYVTTNTIFAFHKLPLVDILAATLLMVNSSKGMSAIDISRHLNINYKTAFVLCHKLREALFKTRDLRPMQGEIHEDGAWINFTPRKPNYRKNNYKQRQPADEKGRKFPKFRLTKRCIISLNQRSANDEQMWGQIVPLSQWITPKVPTPYSP